MGIGNNAIGYYIGRPFRLKASGRHQNAMTKCQNDQTIASRTLYTFVVNAYVVLRQPEIGELVFGVPAPWQRRVVLVHHRVQAFQPVLALLAERAGRAAIDGRRTATATDGRATAAVRVYHGRVVAAVVRAGRHLYRRRSSRRWVVLF